VLLSNVTLRDRLAARGSTRIVIEPLDWDAIQPCSVDVHLGWTLKRWDGPTMDVRSPSSHWWRVQEQAEAGWGRPAGWSLQPGRFYLGVLRERLVLPADLAALLVGCSTVARMGVTPHQQAGLFDPGWDGHGTLEITVACENTVLRPGDRIGQLLFLKLDKPADPTYAGRYQHDDDAQPAREGEPARA
jgi:deoxycytidine triphosphate deaminase